MTRLQRYCFKTLALLALLPVACACGGSSSPEGKRIADSILALKGSDYSGLPGVISLYNLITDSLNTIDTKREKEIQQTILKLMEDEKNDTVALAANMVMSNPTNFGEWFAEDLANFSKDSLNCNVTQNAAFISHRIAIARFLYIKSGEPSSINEMERAIDNYVASLSPENKAALYVSMSTPENLAKLLNADLLTDSTKTEAEKVIEEVRKIYADCAVNLQKFNTTLTQSNKQ